MKQRTRVLLLAFLAGLLVLPVRPAVADEPPTLRLTTDRAVYNHGQSIRFTATIRAMNLTYVLQVRYPGETQWRQVDYAGNINDDVKKASLGAFYNTAVRALLIDTRGTADTADDTIEARVDRTVPVRATLGTTPSGYFVRSGKYAVMSKFSAKFASQSAPAFPGKRCLRHQVQRKYASGWKLVKTGACIVQGKQGRVTWKWSGKHPSRVNFRIRSTFAGDAVNRANTSTWLYFRFR